MSTPLLQQFPSLQSYAPGLLKDLLSSPELTEAFLLTLPEVQDAAAEVERLGRENDDLARRNMDLRDELLALREATAESFAHAQGLKRQWSEIERAQQSLYQRVRPSFLHLRLKHSLAAQDAASEKAASVFIASRPEPSGPASGVDSSAGLAGDRAERSEGRAVEELIRELKAGRKVYHKRAMWAERWTRGEVAWRDD